MTLGFSKLLIFYSINIAVAGVVNKRNFTEEDVGNIIPEDQTPNNEREKFDLLFEEFKDEQNQNGDVSNGSLNGSNSLGFKEITRMIISKFNGSINGTQETNNVLQKFDINKGSTINPKFSTKSNYYFNNLNSNTATTSLTTKILVKNKAHYVKVVKNDFDDIDTSQEFAVVEIESINRKPTEQILAYTIEFYNFSTKFQVVRFLLIFNLILLLVS